MARTKSRPAERAARAPAPVVAQAPRRAIYLRATILALAGALAYASSLPGPFIFDDDASIAQNATIRELRPATSLFPHRESPTAGRPVVNFSFAVNYALGGLDVTGYHVANVVIHVLCALVLFGIVRRMIGAPAPLATSPLQRASTDVAFAAALIWVVHPLNSEAVDYLTQRTESLMALFYLLTVYCAVRAGESATAATKWAALSIACCFLGVGCKESMVTAPTAVMLYDRVFMFASWKDAFVRRWRLYAGLAASWIPLAVIVASGPRVHSAGFQAGVDAWTYLLNQAVMIVRYLQLAVWPRSLVLAYGPPQPLSLGDVLPQAALILALLAVTVFALVRWPRVGFLGAMFFLTLAPTSTIVPVATEVGAERRMYLPLAPLIVLAVVAIAPRLTGADLQASPVRKRAAATILAVASILLATQTMLRAREYRSSLVMAETVLDRWPTGFAHALVGVELATAGRHDEALAHLREGARTYSRAHYHLGGELFNRGRADEALPELQQFVREHPDLLEAVRARTMIGRALMQQRKYTQAEEQFRMVLSMTAPNADAHTTATGFLADALFSQEKFAEAIDQYRPFLAARPADAGGQMNFAIALANIGRRDDATRAFRRAVELNPSDTTARQNLASHLFNLGDLDAADTQAREILKLNPDHAGAHDLLGRVLASRGELAGARIEFERAVQIDPHDAQARADLDQLLRIASGLGRRD
jgi:protein O-mannosyl-transferase